ncbi:hypothetical protein ENSA5_29870 [Enhygromyxa salina]|uniref:Uncharacterized protein n=1 Tax=Enhygromyxa salina TaxID=215803 RepID=A0A2S9Y072_9BACT|nr:hypothetical protein ENSA5_29870 [Enhygromyxa salina]
MGQVVTLSELDEAAIGAEQLEARPQQRPGQAVEDHVQPAAVGRRPDHVDEGAIARAADPADALAAEQRALGLGPGRCEDLGAARPGDLDRVLADAPGRRVDQHALPGLKVGDIFEGVAGRERGDRQGRRRRRVELRGSTDHEASPGPNVAGEAARREGDDRIPEREIVDSRAQRADPAAALATERTRGPEPVEVERVEGQEYVEEVQARRLDLDLDLVRRERRLSAGASDQLEPGQPRPGLLEGPGPGPSRALAGARRRALEPRDEDPHPRAAIGRSSEGELVLTTVAEGLDQRRARGRIRERIGAARVEIDEGAAQLWVLVHQAAGRPPDGRVLEAGRLAVEAHGPAGDHHQARGIAIPPSQERLSEPPQRPRGLGGQARQRLGVRSWRRGAAGHQGDHQRQPIGPGSDRIDRSPALGLGPQRAREQATHAALTELEDPLGTREPGSARPPARVRVAPSQGVDRRARSAPIRAPARRARARPRARPRLALALARADARLARARGQRHALALPRVAWQADARAAGFAHDPARRVSGLVERRERPRQAQRRLGGATLERREPATAAIVEGRRGRAREPGVDRPGAVELDKHRRLGEQLDDHLVEASGATGRREPGLERAALDIQPGPRPRRDQLDLRSPHPCGDRRGDRRADQQRGRLLVVQDPGQLGRRDLGPARRQDHVGPHPPRLEQRGQAHTQGPSAGRRAFVEGVFEAPAGPVLLDRGLATSDGLGERRIARHHRARPRPRGSARRHEHHPRASVHGHGHARVRAGLVEPRAQLGQVMSNDRAPQRRVAASDRGGVDQRLGVGVGVGQPLGVAVEQVREGLRIPSRDRQHQRAVVRDHLGRGHAWRLLDEQVRVGTRDPKRADRRAPRSIAPAGPVGRARRNPQPTGVEAQLGVERGQVVLRRDPLAREAGDDLDQAADPRGRLHVAQLRLAGAEPTAPLPRAVDRPQRVDLDRVAERSAGPVRFDIVDAVGLDPGVGQGRTQQPLLRPGVGHAQADAATVMVDRRPPQPRPHPIALARRVGLTTEQDHAAALAAHEAVGVTIEGLAPAIGGEQPSRRDLGHRRGRQQDLDPTREGQIALASAQAPDRQVDRDQRRRAGRIHRDAGPGQIEAVRHAPRHAAVEVAGRRVGVEARGRVDALAVLEVRDPNEHTDAPVLESIERDASVLEALPRELEDQALLRIQAPGLDRCDRKEAGVKLVERLREQPGDRGPSPPPVPAAQGPA